MDGNKDLVNDGRSNIALLEKNIYDPQPTAAPHHEPQHERHATTRDVYGAEGKRTFLASPKTFTFGTFGKPKIAVLARIGKGKEVKMVEKQ